MIEMLSHEFMQNAIYAGLLAAVACGIIGSLVVVNRMVFLAGGVAHAAYGGVGIAYFMGWPVMPSAVGFTLGASMLMASATSRSMARSDTIVGVLWAAGMALGILLIDLTPGYNVDLMSFLFGSILTVPRSDIWIMVGLDAALLVLVLLFYRDFLALSFDREFARSRGAPVEALHYLMLGMTAVAVVMIISVVGLILVIALVTIPAYMAEVHSRSLAGMMVVSSVLSAFFCLAGLALAYRFDLTSGASIIAAATVCFLIWRVGIRLHRVAKGFGRKP
ncbi:MAG: metal ABC transporter permease [Desulfovibrionaceae bacterium]